MQKVVKFLEQNVQWLALGLGGLFFVYMVWSYVITPPATATIQGQALGPGDVDQYVDEHSGQPLAQVTRDHSSDPSIPKTPRDNVADFEATFNNVTAPPNKMSAVAFVGQVFRPDEDASSPTIPGTPRIPGAVPGNPGAPGAVATNGKITGLPVLPKPEIVGAGGGLSSIQPPQNPQAGGIAVAPTALGPNGQPLPLDKSWATVTFKLNSLEIAKAFAAVQIPSQTKSVVLQVEMMREEQLPDGSWGPENPVRKIPIQGEMPYPTNGQKGLEFTYRQFAEQHESDILQPQFYTVVGGQPWLPPGLPTVAVAAQQVQFDPANFTGDLSKLPLDQKQAVLAARRAKQQELQKNRQQAPRNPGPGRGPGRGGEGIGGGAAAGQIRTVDMMPGANEVFLIIPGNELRPRPFGGGPPDMQDNPDANYGGSSAPPPPGLTPEAQALVQKHPTGPFDPADLNYAGGIICWAHDDDVLPGKTYRYKMHYKMLNPGYVQPSLFVNGKLALQFDVVSDWSAWTQPVDVPAQTTFYVSRNPLSNGVPFEVYHWQNGQLRAKSITVGLGDMIGGPDGDTDYTTGWTVADIRSDPRGGTYVLLTDTSGKTVRRDYLSDLKDPKYIDFQAQIKAMKGQPGQQPPGYGAPGTFGPAGGAAAGGG